MTLRVLNTASLAEYRLSKGLSAEPEPAPRLPGSVTRPEELHDTLLASLEVERAKKLPEFALPPYRTIRITIPGAPVPFARAGANGTRRYTPAKQAAWMKMAQHHAVQQYGPLPPLTDAVSLHVMASFAIPKSWPKWKREAADAGEIFHTDTPDADNLLKIVGDALNGVLFVDDRQVARATVEKRYGEPGVTVTVAVVG